MTTVSPNRPAMVNPRSMRFADLLLAPAAAAPAAAAPAAAAKPQRKDQAALSADERRRFLDGINLLNQSGIFGQLVSIHSDMSHTMHNMHDQDPNDPAGVHGQQRFLPWHRVFLSQLEKRLQELYPPVTIPYWDWSKSKEQGIPDWIRQLPLTVNIAVPQDGTIVSGMITVNRMPDTQERLAQIVSGLDPFPSLEAVKQLTTYTEFATGLEQIHNLVHDWVGGTMDNLTTAAADPLFWMHHANIDRIWWQWQQSPQGKGQNPQLAGVDAIMDPWRYDESQTRDIANFNYVYA